MSLPSTQQKILVIEDDAFTAHAYRGALERAGYAVEVATDGAAGLDCLQRFVPAGVLLDLMLPKMNGIDLLKALRGFHHLAEVPVIVYTNAGIPLLIEQAHAAGASMVFSKSDLTPQRLLTAFAALIRP